MNFIEINYIFYNIPFDKEKNKFSKINYFHIKYEIKYK